MKRAIEPSEIRAGDLIRWEKRGTAVAAEWQAARDKDSGEWASSGDFFLLERRVPVVGLPDQYTLGWVSQRIEARGRDADTSAVTLGAWRLEPDADDNLAPAANGAVSWDLWEKDTYWNVTAFTPATAVPTGALEKLRKYRNGLDWDCATPAVRRIDTFLAAVDAANEANV